jgi:hypothetical protein
VREPVLEKEKSSDRNMPGTDVISQVQSGGDTLTVTVEEPPREVKFWELGDTDILQGTGSNLIAKLKELHGKEKIHGLLKPAPVSVGFDEVLGLALKVKVPIPFPVPLMF